MLRNLAFMVLLLNLGWWMWGSATSDPSRSSLTGSKSSAAADGAARLQLLREASPDIRGDERGLEARCLRLGPVLSSELAEWLAERARHAGAEVAVTVATAGNQVEPAGAEHRYLEIRLAAHIGPDWARNWVAQSPVGLGSEASFERIVCPER